MARRARSCTSHLLCQDIPAFAVPFSLATGRWAAVGSTCWTRWRRTIVVGIAERHVHTCGSDSTYFSNNQSPQARATDSSSRKGRNKSRASAKKNEIITNESVEKIPKYMRNAAKGPLSKADTVRALINWYPGHIAKAERTLRDTVKLVDVVIEVRDCRIPKSTEHPAVSDWIGSRSRLLVLNRADLAPESARSSWKLHLRACGETPLFVNARVGRGVREVKRAAINAGAAVNDKRRKRGLLPRPVRCLVMGFPNVGKSALINKLVGRTAAKSANKPGVTRNYQWIRISDSLELLDMPGIIPAKFISQYQAILLAICDDIGQAAYDNQLIAAAMIDQLNRIAQENPTYFDFSIIRERFRVDPTNVTGEDFLHLAAEKVATGDVERTAVRLLTEFRSGVLGPVALESPDLSNEQLNNDNCNTDDVATNPSGS